MLDKRTQGRVNRRAGEIFEKWIENTCDWYWEHDIACIEKTPEPMKPLRVYDRKKGQFIACYAKQAQPDFKGVLQTGRCVIFDAKHTNDEEIHQSVISDNQWKMFDRYEHMGALCFVLVSIGMNEFYKVPWNDWKNMKTMFGHKYMNLNELEPYRVKTGKRLEILFLGGIEDDNF